VSCSWCACVLEFVRCVLPCCVSSSLHDAPTTHRRIEGTCILTIEDSIFLIKKILTLDDSHIGRNM
jgi:hypothetical protein